MSRKYRQPGYQDHDREESRPSREGPARAQLSPEERIHRRSLRHATAREANEVIRCHHCGRNVAHVGTPSASNACPHCSAPLHCCRTCRHFDSSARWQCRAPITEAVGDKSKANDCEHYSPRVVLDTTGRRSNAPQEAASGSPRAQFDSLFKR